jgi:hypothetical protein
MFTKPEDLVWRNVLDLKVWIGDRDRFADFAYELGYKYFIWNDHVYDLTAQEGKYIETQWDIKDIIA